MSTGRRAEIVRLATRALKVLRAATLPPALRAADDLDRASRDPFVGNCRRPLSECLTTRMDGATLGPSRWLPRATPSTSPDVKQNEPAAPGYGSPFIFEFFLIV